MDENRSSLRDHLLSTTELQVQKEPWLHFQGTCQRMPHLGVMNTGFCSITRSVILLIPCSAEGIRRYQALLTQCLSIRIMQNLICFQVPFPTEDPL